MKGHIRSLISEILKDYERSVRNAMYTKGKEKKKEIKKAEDSNYLIINLLKE